MRPEYVLAEAADVVEVAAVTRDLSTWERVSGNTALRRAFVLAVLALAWEIYARVAQNPLLFPTFSDTCVAFARAIASGELVRRVLNSLGVLAIGYALGLLLAAALTTFAVTTRIGTDFLSTITAMLNPLPAIALLPLALLWFGLGTPSTLFVLLHSVIWPVALNTHAGFLSVSETLRMAGQNYGLRGVPFILRILVPAAFPSILTGMKIGWAFAWRTLIAAELVFGSNGGGGLGWYIFENRNQMEVANVFGGLLTVILIGLLVESLVFRNVENATVRKWGMQR
ncbi:MAG TPA: ABC transporter permease subunit [Variovorax sp.]|nr:ABC transporter permease subunit [Variovorax sp.]HYP84452.1 ABC transporter permease subunit [Variovorax sp.]